MSIISEEDAKKYPDLYQFETYCIELLRGIKILREQQDSGKDTELIRRVAIDSAQQMQAKLPDLLREIETP